MARNLPEMDRPMVTTEDMAAFQALCAEHPNFTPVLEYFRECDECSKPFFAANNRKVEAVTKTRFCSKNCRQKWHRKQPR